MDHALSTLHAATDVVFDVDSTLITSEGLDELAAFLGQAEAVAALTAQAMGGGLPFEVALERRLKLVHPSRDAIAAFLDAHPFQLVEGAAELVAALSATPACDGTPRRVHIVSGGLEPLVLPIAARLGIPPARVHCNRLLFDDTGAYSGFDASRPTARSGGKALALKAIRTTAAAEGCRAIIVMIGDGVTDLEAGVAADAFIGFGGVVSRPAVQAAAPAFVTSFAPLLQAVRTRSTSNVEREAFEGPAAAAAAVPLKRRSPFTAAVPVTVRRHTSRWLSWLPVALEASAPPDGGLWAWLVVAGAFLAAFLAVGLQYTGGIFLSALVKDPSLGTDVSHTSLVTSTQSAALIGVGVLSGKLTNSIGPRRCMWLGAGLMVTGFLSTSFLSSVPAMIASFGLAVGAGSGLVYGPVTYYPSRFFTTYRSTAYGWAIAGSGVGTLALGPAFQGMITAIGWRGTLRVLAPAAGILIPLASLAFLPLRITGSGEGGANAESAVVSPCSGDGPAPAGSGLELRPRKASAVVADDELAQPLLTPSTELPSVTVSTDALTPRDLHQQPLRLATLLRDHKLHRAIAAFWIYGGCFFVLQSQFNKFVQDTGVAPQPAAALTSVQGGLSTAGRVLIGLFVDAYPARKPEVLTIAMLAMAVTTLALPWAGSAYAYLVTTMAIQGFSEGCVVAMQGPIVCDAVGLPNLPLGLGALLSAQIPIVFAFPPAAGALRDATGTYSVVWWVTAGALALSAAVAQLVHRPRP